MQSEAGFGRVDVAARPLAQLLSCPPATEDLLNAAAQCIEFGNGDTIFRQGSPCKGLYIVVSGELLRKADRLDTRLILGTVRVGELVELAAALGDGRHTYTLTGQTSGSLMLLSFDSLQQAFRAHPPLRMQLLEELAREVSRGYSACCAARMAGIRRRGVSSVSEQA